MLWKTLLDKTLMLLNLLALHELVHDEVFV